MIGLIQVSEWEDKQFAEHMDIDRENEVSQCDERQQREKILPTGMGCIDLETSRPEVTNRMRCK